MKIAVGGVGGSYRSTMLVNAASSEETLLKVEGAFFALPVYCKQLPALALQQKIRSYC